MSAYPFYQQYAQYQQPRQVPSGEPINVQNEAEAKNCPVSPGSIITFKDQNLPYIYIKSLGYSPMDKPIFEKYKRVEEEPIKDPYEEIKAQVDCLIERVEALEKPIKKPIKKEVADE